MALDVELNFSDSNANNIAMMCVGGCAIGEFYTGELQLDNSSQQSGNYFSGSMQGALLGAGAEGIMSLISITDNTDYIDYMGSAVFQREDHPLPAPKFGGVSAISAFNAGVLGTVVPSTLVAEENGTDWHPIQLTMNDGSGDYELTRTSTTPLSQGSYTMALSGDTVYWGIWDQASYSIGFAGDGVTPSGDWHYMIAEDTLTEAGVDSLASNLGLIGTHRYNYVGGTDLEEVSYGGSPTTIGSGYVDVNFADLTGTTGISASLNINSNTMTGNGSIGDLYGPGISLEDLNDPLPTGSITGTFAGTQVESLLGSVAYSY